MGELDRSAFGELLRDFRLRSGLSQEQLAERARMSAIAISALERGVRRAPYRTTVALLAEALDLTKSERSLLETAVDRPRRSVASAAHDFTVAGVARHNLPLALTAFFGRESQLTAIASLLEKKRLVTLTGSGGVGKTRAALEVGSTLLHSLADGAWLIDLTPLSDETLLATTVAHALRIEERPDRSRLDTLIDTLSGRAALLIFDNCEHVVAEAARVAHALLAHCPHLRILATSRDPLRVAGEQTYRLPSMNVPSAGEARTLDAAGAASYDAINLFAERAKGADHRFALTDANATAVAEICRRLDGMPLAIELAAARMNMLPAETIATNLDRRFELLSCGKRDAPPRHQTMRALIDWSFDLLAKDEQIVFVRLSIFADGCSLPAATSVCSGDGIEETDVFALLASLVEKSLVVADLTGRVPRYRLLESFRAYGREKLRQSGVESLLAGRHAAAMLALAQGLWILYDCETDAAFQNAALADIYDWRAALEWTLLSRCDVALGRQLVGELSALWHDFLPTEGRRWIRVAREASHGQTDESVPALLDLAEFVCFSRAGETMLALAAAERALQGLTGVDAARPAVWAQFARLRTMVILGRADEAEPMLREALGTAQSLSADRLVGYLQTVLAEIRFNEGDIVTARAHLSEAHAAFLKIASARNVAMVMDRLSVIEFIAGDLQTALRLIDDSISNSQIDDTILSDYKYNTKALYLIALGRYDEARSIARVLLEVLDRHQRAACVAFALNNLASIAARSAERSRGDLSTQAVRAALTFGFANSFFAAHCNDKRDLVDKKIHDGIYTALRDRMSEAELNQFMMLGAQQNVDEAIREALLM